MKNLNEHSQYDYNYYGKGEKFYNESNNSQKEEKSYKRKETPKSEPKKEYEKYERFSDSNFYVVLGVSPNDSLKTIHRAYQKLLKKYHPDLNRDQIKKYTEITQLINNAYEQVEKYKKQAT